MKIKYVFLSMLACGMLAACNNDEVAEGSNNGNVSLEGESYMAIRLVAANETGTRASEGNPAFELGEGDENEVTSVEFYFYNDEGTFVVKGKTISSFKWTDQAAGSNIESISNVMVVLENVPEAPTQVLAVLNGGTVVGDLTNMDMEDALGKTISAYSYQAGEPEKTYFVMSNSAYVTGTGVQWATPITTANLQSSADLAEDHPVDIYVERVAAKVELAKSGSFSASVNGDIQVDGKDAELEITVNGWGLSGTNKSAYCVKNIQNTAYWTDWNAESNHRSYWAEDPNYSTGNYPSDYNGWNAENADHWALNYITYNDLTLSAEAGNEASAYCLENTMDKMTLAYDATTQSIQEPAVTHVLIAATMNVIGSAAQTLYRYKGYFYTESEYKEAVLSDWEATGEGMIYTKTEGVGEDDPDTYTPLAVSDVEIEDKGAGKVNLKLTTAALAETWYTLEGYNPESGEATSATEFDSEKLATLFADVNDADGFKDGKMYYCVPIEHLNAAKGEVGSYGVVRNHLYKLTLDKIKNLGTAVYDPEEAIIPDYNPETYYVAARLNILSWHIVEQNVSL